MGPPSSGEQLVRRWSWARVLLLVPFIAVLWVSFYNRSSPAVFGVPFFYWYQLVWIVLATVLIGLVYLIEHRPRPRSPYGRAGAP